VIQSHHGAPGSVPEVKGVDGPRKVDRSETALAQQKAVQGPARVRIEPYNLPFGVNPTGLSVGSAGEINRGETAVAQQKAVPLVIRIKVHPYNLPGRVDPVSLGVGRAGGVDRGEAAIAQETGLR